LPPTFGLISGLHELVVGDKNSSWIIDYFLLFFEDFLNDFPVEDPLLGFFYDAILWEYDPINELEFADYPPVSSIDILWEVSGIDCKS
jgi:hypothetical protein